MSKQTQEAAPTKLNAQQQLKALQNLALTQENKINILADEIDKLSNLLLTLNKKVNAIIDAAEGGAISKQAVGAVLVDKAVQELKARVDELVNVKAIIASDEEISTPRTFIVAREIDAKGDVVNPRTQFALISLDEKLHSMFMGKKVGDVVTPEGSDIKIEIQEVYKLADMQSEQPEAEAAT